MASLESFTNLSKLSDDLLKKNFFLDQNLGVSVYAAQDKVSFKSSFKSSQNSASSNLTYFQYKGSNLLLKQELLRTYAGLEENVEPLGKLKSTVEYTLESRPHIKTKLELDSGAGYQKNTISAEVTNPKYRAKFAVSDDAVFRASGVYGKSELGAGVDLTYDLGPVRFTKYNAAVWVDKNAWRAVFKHESENPRAYSLGNLVASLYFKDVFEWAVAANIKYSAENARPSFVVAGEKKLDNNNSVKARASLDGFLALALRSKLSKLVQVSASMQFKPLEKQIPASYGLRLKLNQ